MTLFSDHSSRTKQPRGVPHGQELRPSANGCGGAILGAEPWPQLSLLMGCSLKRDPEPEPAMLLLNSWPQKLR